MDPTAVNNFFGDADLFLMDWILKGKVPDDARILDAGCGSGRNLLYFLLQDFDVTAIDKNESEIRAVNFLCRSMGHLEVGQVADIENFEFSAPYDFVICSRVLHFAESLEQFKRFLNSLHRTCAKAGSIYLSMASTQGLSDFSQIDEFKVEFPNGDVRFALNEALMNEIGELFDHLVDPRTVVFGDHRAQTSMFLQPR